MFTIFRYSGEGHDVVTPEDMREAIHSNGGVKGLIASVVSVDRQHESKTVTRIPNISQLNNFTFKENGVTCRRAYGIGQGLFLPHSQLKECASLSGFLVRNKNTSFLNVDNFSLLS
jgi:hypothetical protein